jgi:hypothetical protein
MTKYGSVSVRVEQEQGRVSRVVVWDDAVGAWLLVDTWVEDEDTGEYIKLLYDSTTDIVYEIFKTTSYWGTDALTLLVVPLTIQDSQYTKFRGKLEKVIKHMAAVAQGEEDE